MKELSQEELWERLWKEADEIACEKTAMLRSVVREYETKNNKNENKSLKRLWKDAHEIACKKTAMLRSVIEEHEAKKINDGQSDSKNL